MNWFYWNDGERIGPVSSTELKRLAQTGVVSPSTTVEDETGKSALAERVAGLFAAKPASPPSQEWETRFQKLTATLVETGNVVDRRINDCLKRLDGVAQTSQELAGRLSDVENRSSAQDGLTSRRLDDLEASVEMSRNAWVWRVDSIENLFSEKCENLARRVDCVEKLTVDKCVELTQRADSVEKSLVDASAELTKRVGSLDVRLIGTANLSQRVSALERKDVSAELTKRLDALETSVGEARSGLTQRVAELEKKGGASGDFVKRLEAVEKQSAASNGVAGRLAAVEKSSDAKVGALIKRVEEVENRVDANSAWARRLDAFTRRLDTSDGELEKRVDKILDDLAKRFETVEAALKTKTSAPETRNNEDVVALAERLSQTLESFSVRFERLAERLDALERRFDENERLDDLVLEDVETDTQLAEWGEPASEPTKESERYWAAEDNAENASAQARRFEVEKGLVGERFAAGKYFVGADLPSGKYRAEIWENWASVEVELGENYQCYVLETGEGVVDGYESFAIVDLPEGATVTLDNSVDFTFLSR